MGFGTEDGFDKGYSDRVERLMDKGYEMHPDNLGAKSNAFPRDFEDDAMPRPFSAIDATEVLNKELSETDELLNILAKRTEFYRAPNNDTSPEITGVKYPSSSGMAESILQSASRVSEFNRRLNYLLDTLR